MGLETKPILQIKMESALLGHKALQVQKETRAIKVKPEPTGGTGATGNGVKSIVEQYYKSTSATS